jgi:hypothetical protein
MLTEHVAFPLPGTKLCNDFNPFQSNFSANRILPSSYFVLGGKDVGGLLVIILQF